ncbi:zinc finger CCCH domain-containing protein 62-like [Magnolia sinica]|uniref:zinc finger CCCH domain-containing protein 62-like n=1 Tax=Magnolia sinica TaxID=86752 RepID=UPI00265A9DE6|nr:zinc finger CCCH domain-containing protein 62-like [Magnolia sinica]
MAICDREAMEEELDLRGEGDFVVVIDSETDEYDSDDSEDDPSYDVLEETRSGRSKLSEKKPKSRAVRVSKDVLEETRSSLSKLSLKKSKSWVSKEVDLGDEEATESFDVKVPELNEKDEKCFEIVEEIIRAGQLGKLKMDQCKIYLRKFGLRLTGKKEVLMERITEHLEVIDGGGEKKYPISSFVLNCKGDACTGDVVMFEQNVYELYSIVSRSATGPPCGTRIVAGRIVKESYGAAKQQHTFTIEVLWSKGEKPLPPLHPLLIKGRNLYRLKTMRQRWADEEERRKVLVEKHSRGSHARCSRETRIQHKEMRKMLGGSIRIKEKENISTHERRNHQQQNPIQQKEIRQPNPIQQQQHPNIWTGSHEQQIPIHSNGIRQPIPIQQQQSHPNIWTGNHEQQNRIHRNENQQPNIQQHPNKWTHSSEPQKPVHSNENRQTNIQQQHPNIWKGSYGSANRSDQNPLVGGNCVNTMWGLRASSTQRQLCPFYPRGRCWYGDACKYLHE